MGNLTRATYANQRMTLSVKLRQRFKREMRNTMSRATWVIRVACFIIHVFPLVSGDTSQKAWRNEARHVLLSAGLVGLVGQTKG